MLKKVKAFAPATVANLAVGFDVLGLALNKIGDTVEIGQSDEKGMKISSITGAKNLPLDPIKNCCTVVIQHMLNVLGVSPGLDIKIHKGFKPGSGLGSSAASSAAAAYALNTLLVEPFDRKDLVRFAMEGERIASDVAHADNVAPSILGGITLVRNNDPLDIIQLPVPKNLLICICFQQVSINTAYARSILKEEVSLKTATRQWADLAAFVSAIHSNDFELMRRSMNDHLIEGMRSPLIPNYDTLKSMAVKHNAIGFGISGSGPSVFAILDNPGSANSLSTDFKSFLDDQDMEALVFTDQINPNGAIIVE